MLLARVATQRDLNERTDSSPTTHQEFRTGSNGTSAAALIEQQEPAFVSVSGSSDRVTTPVGVSGRPGSALTATVPRVKRRPLHPAVGLGSLAAFLAALFAVFIAALTKSLICETVCHKSLTTAQLVVAVAGLLPVGGLFLAAVLGKRRLALVTLLVGVLTYVAWGVLNDAAVHGWDDLKVF
jgi:drug/metabolite transporter (DMT)-like permease